MPIPQVVKIDPLDLQKNIAIGISLPFNGPAGPFNKTYSTQEQAKYDLINLLLTNKGERVFNPEFGTDLRPVLFEPITEEIIPFIKNLITTSVDIYVPAVQVTDIIIKQDKEHSMISISVTYKLKISGVSDQVTVQFI
jgi:phage baseplate assembly protein W